MSRARMCFDSLPAPAREKVVVFLRENDHFHRQCPRDYLGKAARDHHFDLSVAGNDRDLETALADAEIFAGGDVPRSMFARVSPRRLRWIHAISSGVERIMIPEVVRSAAIVTNSAGTMAPEVAEHAFALLLALTRRIDISLRAQIRSEWAAIREENPPISLAGQTLGIIGYGHIGREIANRARAFNMRVIALRRSVVPPDSGVDMLVGADGLEALLGESDAVVVTVPHTSDTTHLIGEKQFRAMKREALFVNVARGATVDQAALEEALRTGRIAAAASDVFSTEPLPPGNSLWTVPNLLITPHIGGASQRVWFKIIDLFCENLARYRRGEPLANVINKQSGY